MSEAYEYIQVEICCRQK